MAATRSSTERLGWNDARSLASRMINDEAAWGEILKETPLTVSDAEISRVKEDLPEDGSERVNELARRLLQWQDRENPDVNIDELPTDVGTWNDARSVAAAMKTLVAVEATDVFDELRTHVSTPVPDYETAEAKWESVSAEDGGAALNDYARWLMEWGSSVQSAESESPENTRDNPYEAFTPTSRAEECANELLRTFEAHDGGYGDIFSEFNGEFDLPSLGRANVVVVNAQGDTHEERVRDLVHWLENELDESERAGNYRPTGMH